MLICPFILLIVFSVPSAAVTFLMGCRNQVVSVQPEQPVQALHVAVHYSFAFMLCMLGMLESEHAVPAMHAGEDLGTPGCVCWGRPPAVTLLPPMSHHQAIVLPKTCMHGVNQ